MYTTSSPDVDRCVIVHVSKLTRVLIVNRLNQLMETFMPEYSNCCFHVVLGYQLLPIPIFVSLLTIPFCNNTLKKSTKIVQRMVMKFITRQNSTKTNFFFCIHTSNKYNKVNHIA